MTTLDEARSSLRGLIVRRDAELVDNDTLIDRFLMEAVQRLERVARIVSLETAASLTVSDGAVELPVDWLETIDVLAHGELPETLVTGSFTLHHRLAGRTGTAFSFQRVGTRLQLAPEMEDGAKVALIYHARPALPSSGPQTSAVLREAGDLVVFDAARRACLHYRDGNGAAMFEAQFLSGIAELEQAVWQAKTGGAKAVMQSGAATAEY